MRTIESFVIRRHGLAVFRRESDNQEQQFVWPPDSVEISSAMEAFANGSTLYLVRFESKTSMEVQRDECFGGNSRGKNIAEALDALSMRACNVLGGRT